MSDENQAQRDVAAEADVVGEKGEAAEQDAAAEQRTAAETPAEKPEPADKPDDAPAETSKSAPAATRPRRPARQWVTMRGGSMDLRAGAGVLSELPHTLRSAAGKPQLCAVVYEAGAPGEVLRTLHDNLCDQGFEVRSAEMAGDEVTFAAVERLDEALFEAGVTSDDMVVAVGGARALSVASFACSRWCGGVQFAVVPLDLSTAVGAITTPLALDAAGLSGAVSQDGAARYMALDLDIVDTDPESEEVRLAFALMAQTALCDSDRSFGRLWDRADELAAGDTETLVEQVQDTLKSRGKIAAATSAALRQSLELGTTFAGALRALAPEVERSVALADGMRFAARIGVVQESLSIDDMLAVDEVLERLGIPTARAAVDPDALVAHIREERFRRSRRFMLSIPRALGRARLAVMTDELLAEHAAAWCASRPQ